MYVPVAELAGVHELYLRPVGHLGVVVLLEDVRTGLATVILSPTLRLSHMAWIQSIILFEDIISDIWVSVDCSWRGRGIREPGT